MIKSGMMLGDRYEIIELIGSGGMSEVYKAKDHKLNRYVAVKVLKNEFSDDRNFVSKFRVEAQSAAGLAHPNIVNVYDVGEDDGIYYIVMEYVEGITLKEYINDHGRLHTEQALDFALQIASGIEMAHQNHTIHRDIKPQNIIVSKNGTLKVTDFGIARAATSNTVASNAMGSVHYISPEQARGGYSDEKSDIYSLGITMYEMVTGKLPFEGDNNVTVALMHIQGEMIPPRQYYPDIPASFEKVILKCTQKKAERRYLTASALIADLRKVATDPNGDFVVIGNPSTATAATVMMSQEEMESIKQSASQIPYQEQAYGEEQAYQQDAYAGQDPYAAQDPYAQGQDPYAQGQDPYAQQGQDAYAQQAQQPQQQAQPQQQPRQRATSAYQKQTAQSTYSPAGDYSDDVDIESEFFGEDDGSSSSSGTFDYLNNTEGDGYDEFNPDLPEEDELDPKLQRIAIIGGILAAVIIAMFVMLLVGRAAGWFHFGGGDKNTEESVATEVTVDVTGMTLQAAEEALKKENISYVIEHESSDEVDADIVISQSYKKGEMLPEGVQLKVVVSAGKEEVSVPNVVGYEATQADTILKDDYGFVVTHAYEYSDDVEKDHVISTEPTASQMVGKGSTVKIVVSNGAEVKEIEVPDLRGKNQQEAQAALQNVKLNLGAISEEYSDSVEAGKVINQSIAGGTKINEGNSVDVTLSKGPQPTEEQPKTYKVTVSGSISYNGAADGQSYNVTVQYVVGDTIKNVVSGQVGPGNPKLDIPAGSTITGLPATGNLQILYNGGGTKPGEVSEAVNTSVAEE